MPRENNYLADYMGNLALKLKRTAYTDDLPTELQHPVAECNMIADADVASAPCKYCTAVNTADLMCDMCGLIVCKKCAKVDSPPRGFFYCKDCKHNHGDVTLDHHLTHYLFYGQHSTTDLID